MNPALKAVPVLAVERTQAQLSEEDLGELNMLEEKKAEVLAAQEQQLELLRIEAEKQAKEIINQAKIQAEATVRQAEAQHTELKERIAQAESDLNIQHDEAMAQIKSIKAEAYNDGMVQVQTIADELEMVLSTITNAEKEMYLSASSVIVSLAVDIARQILAREVKTDFSVLEEQVLRSVMKVVGTKSNIQVSLSPLDREAEASLAIILENILENGVKLSFVYKDEVEQGSCMVETSGGKLDARFSTQISSIIASFEKYLGHKVDVLEDTELQIEEFSGKDSSLEEPTDKDIQRIITEFETAEAEETIEVQPVQHEEETTGDNDMPEHKLEVGIDLSPSDAELMDLDMSMDGLLSEAGSSELDGLIAGIIEEEEVDDAPELTDTLPSSEEEAPKAGTVELENHDDVEDDFNFSEESFLDDEDEDEKDPEELDEDKFDEFGGYKDPEAAKAEEVENYSGAADFADDPFGEGDGGYSETDERFPEY